MWLFFSSYFNMTLNGRVGHLEETFEAFIDFVLHPPSLPPSPTHYP